MVSLDGTVNRSFLRELSSQNLSLHFQKMAINDLFHTIFAINLKSFSSIIERGSADVVQVNFPDIIVGRIFSVTI